MNWLYPSSIPLCRIYDHSEPVPHNLTAPYPPDIFMEIPGCTTENYSVVIYQKVNEI